MGQLRNLQSGVVERLLEDHLVGRSAHAALRLEESYVSAQHASVRWVHGQWQVKDLGSRNGTFVDSELLRSRQSRLITVGTRISFGRPEQTWELVDGSPPIATVTRLDDELAAPLIVERDMLPLPTADEPLATLMRTSSGSWQLELEHETLQLSSGQTFELLGHRYRFVCPSGVSETSTSEWPGRLQSGLAAFTLAFEVSQDEEHVAIQLETTDERLDLGSRGHNYLLLILARKRIEDGDTGIEEAARGWVYQDDLAKWLKAAPDRLNIDIFRIRRQFEGAGVPNAAAIIERRPRAKQLRIGISNLSIRAGA